MAKENTGSPKYHQLEAKRRRLTWILGATGLCVICYFLGSRQGTTSVPSAQSEVYERVGCNDDDANAGSSDQSSETDQSTLQSSDDDVTLDFESHHGIEIKDTKTSLTFAPCDMSLSEYTPCQDPVRSKKFDRDMLKYRERHCPTKDEQLRCLIPAPPRYKAPFKWPQSRDYAWYDNIPHKELSIEKAVQNWIQVEGDRFRFPGGGTMFPRGADAYIDDINELIPLTDGTIRTAIDTGCGVSSCPLQF